MSTVRERLAKHRAHPAPEELLQRVWPPMLAVLAQPPLKEDDYWLDVKYDGYRGLAGLSAGRLAFQTRNKLDLSPRFPDVARAIAKLRVPEAVIDGEVVAFDAQGVTRFQQLMTPGVEHHYMAFDLLWLDGEDIRGRPIEERRELLENLLGEVARPIHLSERLNEKLEEALAEARRRGLEGVIAKRRGSIYRGGRSSDWLKLKVFQAQEVVIVGYTPISTGSNEIGALLVGVREGNQYRFAGKVGTGFTQAMRRQLRAKLESDRIEAPPVVDPPRERDAIWVKPRYVAQVAFSEWTRDGKLRQPSFQGLREDKKPEEVSREMPEPVPVKPKASKAATDTPKVELTHPDKVIYPKSGLTKRDVFNYFSEIAPFILPALDERALAFEQWPQGISKPGIFRQHAKGVPPWATSASVPHERGQVSHLIVDRPETLLWLANQSALTLHIPSSRISRLTEPDWVVFDLDPPEGRWDELIELANALRKFLQQLGVDSIPKTSGKRGLHVVVPIARGHTHQDALEFAVAITQTLERGLPKLATTVRTIAKRQGRVYLDALQNGYGKTMVAPYSLRAIEGAPVSTPLHWSEVTPKLDPLSFNLKTMRARLKEVGNLFSPALEGSQHLPRLG
jgi:bifunctional non-homologous end joining protein LigD